MNKTGFRVSHREMRAAVVGKPRLSLIENQVHTLRNDNRQQAKKLRLSSLSSGLSLRVFFQSPRKRTPATVPGSQIRD